MSRDLLCLPRIAPVAVAVLLALAPAVFGADEHDHGTTGTGLVAEYAIDPGYTQVVVSCEHFGMVDMTAILSDCRGTVWWDEGDLGDSGFEFNIAADSFHSGSPALDKVATGPDFLDAENFPEIQVKSRSIEATQGKAYQLIADITLHGITRRVRIPLTVTGPLKDPQGGVRIGLRSSLALDRREYGLAFDEATPDGKPVVGYGVRISIAAEATRKM